MAARDPIAEPLSSPSGVPLTALTWAEVRSRLAAHETYLLATSGQGGRPHVVPVLGVWLDGTVCFNTGRHSRKARDLDGNNGCAVTVPGHDVDLVLEGTAQEVRDAALLQRIAELFLAKYPWWHPVVRGGEFYDPADTAFEDPKQVFATMPTTVFAFGKEKGFSATRWRF
ncbi:pyridoxamine 5'-phosphate oxidase family protein [Actinomadura sp. NTSP31]|uniref:pyridoxamine 5'-phosphate oxidase family protein n=1 Tax=Actinomadura sp. NTSP31 TaxID=1735447 RepID=UPI0035BFE363